MTRRKFNADVAVAVATPIRGISGVALGPDDGDVDCIYTNSTFASHLSLRITAGNVDDYPNHQGFHGSTECENVNSSTLDVLSDLVNFTEGKSVTDSLRILSRQLDKALQSLAADRSDGEDAFMADASGDDLDYDEDEEEGDTEVEFEDYDLEIPDNAAFGLSSKPATTSTQRQVQSNARLRQDLTRAKWAGFKIGLWSEDDMFSLSLQVRKLGLPQETLTAWHVKPTDYFVLLCRYDDQYHPLEVFAAQKAPRNPVQFRVGKCTTYKPCTVSARRAFAKPDQDTAASPKTTGRYEAFDRLYMSESLDLWMDKEFAALLRFRLEHQVLWDQAKVLLTSLSKDGHLQADKPISGVQDGSEENEAVISPTASPTLNTDFLLRDPRPSGSDKYNNASGPSASGERSLPLVAMQFALRYFVKSSQYCMVCHLKTSDDFVAIKPYVCDDPLCLYQYMTLGFGPRIEHEIISQPLVVDLLITFFIVGLQQNKLREYPVGLDIRVPALPSTLMNKITLPNSMNYPLQVQEPPQKDVEPSVIQCVANIVQRCVFRSHRNGIINGDIVSLKPGDIFVLMRKDDMLLGGYTLYHCVAVSVDFVRDAVNFDCFSVVSSTPKSHEDRVLNLGASEARVEKDVDEDLMLYPFEHELGELSPNQSRAALAMIVSTLPAVADIRSYLTQKSGANIANCPGISKPSLALLRWIIASNRSMIVQIDSSSATTGADTSSRTSEKLVGVPERWAQFRLAQGSPEKEERFCKAIVANSLNKPAPTIFAWHGSPLGNWHSIIRQGLDFSVMAHGRSYGNGVYFSPHWDTSCGYIGGTMPPLHSWSKSQLQPLAAVSLCEIVNKPESFVSKNPHYVVGDVDWIQCRYLLVQTNDSGPASQQPEISPARNDTVYLDQDPVYKVVGPLKKLPSTVYSGPWAGREVRIPKAASSITRLGLQSGQSGTSSMNAIVIDSDDSDGSDEEDCDLKRLLLETPDGQAVHDDSNSGSSGGLTMDFRPGTLNIDSLPKLPAPTWATDSGRKTLGREVKKLQKVQATTPLHQLGWYIDFDKVDNLFHWVVELHSFDPTLPLAQDMKASGIQSIVLELRFGRSFPISPLFVRVIRPRFLPFLAGGGGHVTAGGAMCMELLTNSGWSPVASIESVLLQVRMAMCSLDPRPARLQPALTFGGKPIQDYGIEEAVDAYKRSARAHGWQIPPDLEDTARAA